MGLFNYDKYFEKVLNQKYEKYIKFHRDKQQLLTDIVYAIQKKMDNVKEEEYPFVIYIKPSRYPTIFFPFFFEENDLPCVVQKPSYLGFAYEMRIIRQNLKNIENKYNEIMQEKILSKEEFFDKHKEELLEEVGM